MECAVLLEKDIQKNAWFSKDLLIYKGRTLMMRLTVFLHVITYLHFITLL